MVLQYILPISSVFPTILVRAGPFGGFLYPLRRQLPVKRPGPSSPDPFVEERIERFVERMSEVLHEMVQVVLGSRISAGCGGISVTNICGTVSAGCGGTSAVAAESVPIAAEDLDKKIL